MRHGRPLALLIVLVFVLVLAAPAGAQVAAGSKSATAGPTTATLTWQAGTDFAEQPALQITRAGAVVFDSPLVKQCTACSELIGPDTALTVRDLDGDGEPEVLVDTYSGGAHCCTVTPIFRWTGSGYRRLTALFGDVGYDLKDLDGDGRPEFVTADDRFAYAFTAYAFSGLPLRVLDYGTDRSGRTSLRDVTAGYPALVASDAASYRHEIAKTGRGEDARGYVAAYVADLYRLDRKRQASAYLRSALRRGLLDSPEPGPDIWPQGQRYIRALKRFLARRGYA